MPHSLPMTFLADLLAVLHYYMQPHMHAALFGMVAIVWGYVTVAGWNPLADYLARRSTDTH